MGIFLKKHKKIISIVLIIGIIFAIILNITKQSEALNVELMPEAKGFQWEISKGDKSMYLIGTMHPINKEYNYFTDNVNDIIDKTDVLAIEINPTESETVQVNLNGIYPNNKSIEDELNKRQIKNLKSICNEIGIDYEQIKVLKPHILINNLQAILYDKAGLVMETFDDMLKSTIKSKGKEVVQLETMEFQTKLLSKINGIESLKFILDNYKEGKFIENGEETIKYSKGLMDGYAKRDTSVMESAIELQKQNPLSYKLMITDRNKNMVNKMEQFFKDNKTYTIAVGALHFFGDDGIVKMMQDKGYEVKLIG